MPPPTPVQAVPGIPLRLSISVPTTGAGKEEESHTEIMGYHTLGQEEITTTSCHEDNGLKKEDVGAKLE